jgi:hypothetical protein
MGVFIPHEEKAFAPGVPVPKALSPSRARTTALYTKVNAGVLTA